MEKYRLLIITYENVKHFHHLSISDLGIVLTGSLFFDIRRIVYFRHDRDMLCRVTRTRNQNKKFRLFSLRSLVTILPSPLFLARLGSRAPCRQCLKANLRAKNIARQNFKKLTQKGKICLYK